MARDRVGARPFYYTIYNKTLYFASQLNAIIANAHIETELDEFAVYDYLTYTNVPAPSTILKNIKKIPAAHYLFFKPGEPIHTKQYWSPITTQPLVTLSEKEIIAEIREKFSEAVRIRMQADVNVGMLLSGGLDSSANLAYMSRFSSKPIKTYTAGFENKHQYKNEFEHAKQVATLFKADHQEVVVTEKDFFDFLPKLAYLQDEPIADPAIIPLHFISKLASRDQVKVLLGGEGSDELFIGYQHWRLIYEFEKVFLNKPRLAGVISYLHRKSIFKGRRPHYLSWAFKLKNQWPTFWSGTELRTEADKHKILSQDFLHKIGSYHSFTPIRRLYSDLTSVKPYETFDWMTVNDLQHRLPDQLLARLDRMMMSASIEGRHPFLDVNLIEFVLRIPPHLKVKQKTEKYLLKKAFESVLPREIIYRPKDSFSVPMTTLFKNADRKKEYLDIIGNFNKRTGIFLNSYLKELESPAKMKEFWNVLNLALWHEAHM
jgi:asparagine synthase (glutamine-hydrolysing)